MNQKLKKVLCPECNGVMEYAKTDHKIDDLGITIHDVQCVRCANCNYELYHGEHVKLIQDKMKKLGIFGWGLTTEKEIETTITEFDQHLVFSIPRELKKMFELKAGDKVKFDIKSNGFIEVVFT